MPHNEIAWLILRVVFAGFFLYPLKTFLSNWQATLGTVKVLTPVCPQFFAIVMVSVMILGALGILLGVLAQVAGLALLIYCLLGVRVHLKLSQTVEELTLSNSASAEDKKQMSIANTLGSLGHATSAQKNFVLAAVACFFMIMGSGPLSLMHNLIW
jgi:uncharacterized membrane protein YphA (DoxX/SURF4 family)